MALELLGYTLRRPVNGLKSVSVIREFRKNRESLRWAPRANGELQRIQYEQIATRVSVSLPSIVETVEEWIYSRPLRHLRAYRRPGVERFLKTCRIHGLNIGAFSDYPTHEKVEALGLGQWFTLHLCSTDASIDSFKPSPRGIRLACKMWRLEPNELLYIGDQPKIDGAAAVAAGTRFILIGHRKDSIFPAVKDFYELTDRFESFLE
jgi:HAD superfamily hydrolase (TIGR01549 family)